MFQPILRGISLAILLSTVIAAANSAAASNLPPTALHPTPMSAPAPAIATPQPASHFDPVGSLGGQIGTSVITGTLAYLVEGADLTIVDVADPAKPRRLARVTWSHELTHMVIQGDLLYAVSERDLEIIDISSVLTPTLRGIFTTSAEISDLEVRAGLAYMATGNDGLQIIDVTDTANPVLRGRYITPGPAIDVAVVGTLAYVAASSSLLIFDTSQPDHPSLLGSYTPPPGGGIFDMGGIVYSVQVANGVAVIVVSYSQLHGPVSILHILDVSHPTAPGLLSRLIGPDVVYSYGVHIAAIVNNRAYVVIDLNWIQIVDLSDPAKPKAFGRYSAPITYAQVVGTRVYGTGPHDVLILDASNPNAIAVLGRLPAALPTTPWDIQLGNGLAYIPNGENGIDVVDVSDPTTPAIKGSYRSGTPLQSIKVLGNRGYSVGYRVLEILDLTNPIHPALLGRYTSPQEEPFPLSGGPIDVVGGRAYIATLDSGLQIFDIADPAKPQFLGKYQEKPAPADTSVRDVQVRGQLAYVAGGARGLDLIDVTNPVTPTLIGSYATHSIANNLRLIGNLVYVAGGGGLDIFSIAQPRQPTLLGSAGYSAAIYTQDLEVAGDRAYVATENGVYTFDVSNPGAPLLLDRYPPPAGSGRTKVAVAGDMIYLTDLVAGLQILASRTPTTTAVSAAGGSLPVPGDGVWYTFPANTFTTTVMLEHTLYYPGVGIVYSHLRSVGAIVDVTAFDQSDAHPVQPLRSYTLTVQYDDAGRGAAIEATLALYHWDGSRWLKDPSSRVDPAANTITAQPEQFGHWTIMGDTHEIWLPVVMQ